MGFLGLLPAPAGPVRPAAPLISIPDPFTSVGSYVIAHVVTAVSGLLRAVSSGFLDVLGAPVAGYVLHTPDLLAEPTLRSAWLLSLAVLAACVGLLLAVAGCSLIPGQHSRLAVAARETLGMRLAGGLVLAATSLPLAAVEVDLTNRVVDVFLQGSLGVGNDPLDTTFRQALHGNAGSALAVLVTVTVGVVLLVELVLLGLARWATVWLLVVLAPILVGLAVLPGGAGVARLWWRLQLTSVVLPVANAVLLATYVAMFSSPRTGLVGALAGVAVLGLLTKLPRWAAGAAVGSAVGLEAADIRQRLHGARRAVRGR